MQEVAFQAASFVQQHWIDKSQVAQNSAKRMVDLDSLPNLVPYYVG